MLEGLLLCALATWRLSVLLVEERGPWDIMLGLRGRFGITHDPDGKPISWPDGIGALFGCVWCVSVWLAVPVVVAWWLCPVVVFAVAVMGAVAVIESARGR